MTQDSMAAPALPSTGEPVQLLVESVVADDPSLVVELFAEVDAILCAAAAALCRPPAPPVIGCALREPRCAGRCYHPLSPRPRSGPVRRVDPMQRSPPQLCGTRHHGTDEDPLIPKAR